MKKLKLITSLIFAISIVLTSCSNATFNIDLTLPENVTIQCDLKDSYPTNVNLYDVSYKELKMEDVVDVLMQKEYDEKNSEDYTNRHCYSIDGTEVLQLGEPVFNNDIFSNIIYYKDYKFDKDQIITDYRIRDRVARTTSLNYSDDFNDLKYDDKKMSDYKNKGDLPFKSFNKVNSEMLNIFNSLGIENIKLTNSFILDCNTMNEHMKICNSYSTNPIEYTFAPDDELYLFYYKQAIDGIEFCSSDCTAGRFMNSFNNNFVVEYNAKGLNCLHGYNAININKKTGSSNIISMQQALEVYFKNYPNDFQADEEIFIENIELNYTVLNENSALKCIPIWVVTSYRKTYLGNGEFYFPRYTRVVSAIDGSLL